MATTPQCKRALDQFETDLSRHKNVVGLGIVPETEGSNGPAKMAVAVYVTKKMPAAKLSANDLLPKSVKIRGRTGQVRVPVRVIEQGNVELESFGKE